MKNSLDEILEVSAKEGFLTFNGAKTGIQHSKGFLDFPKECLETNLSKEDVAVDLGTGGGVPGLVLAALTQNKWILIDQSSRRCRFLRWASQILEISNRVEIVEDSVEKFAKSNHRSQVSLVTARLFNTPATTAECAAPFLKNLGLLVVSEPPPTNPGFHQRWSKKGLSKLGLSHAAYWHTGMFGYRAFVCRGICPDMYPRGKTKIKKEPLF
tara:strand:- start:15 stop:650 length:636 start_codon:yes stop_codon:yes gene_type:complete